MSDWTPIRHGCEMPEEGDSVLITAVLRDGKIFTATRPCRCVPWEAGSSAASLDGTA